MVQSVHTIGILMSPRSRLGTTIKTAIRELGYRVEEYFWDDIVVETCNGELQTNIDADVVLNWYTVYRHRGQLDRLGLLHSLNECVPVLNTGQTAFLTSHKPASLSLLAQSETVRVPDTFYSTHCSELTKEIESRPGLVQKPTMGGGGTDVQQISEPSDYSILSGPEAGVVQQSIETDGDTHSDIRAVVVGDEVKVAMRREAPSGKWRTNISTGGSGHAVTLPDEAIQMAVDATETVGLDYTGVDLIQGIDGDWYVLELNAPFGFSGLHEATGENAAAYIGAYAIREAGGSVDESRVSELAQTLDISGEKTRRGDTFFNLKTRDTCVIAGRDGGVETEIECDDSIDEYLIGQEVASEARVGPVYSLIDDPRSGYDQQIPLVGLSIGIGGGLHSSKAALCDLSDRDAGFVAPVPVLVADKQVEKYSSGSDTENQY